MSSPACSIIHPTGSVGKGVNHGWRWAYSDAIDGRASEGSERTNVDWAMSEALQPRHDPHRPELDAAAAQPSKRSKTPSRIIADRNASAPPWITTGPCCGCSH